MATRAHRALLVATAAVLLPSPVLAAAPGLYGLANAYEQSYYFASFFDNATIVDLGFKYLDELPTDALADLDTASQTYYFLEDHWDNSSNQWELRHTGLSLIDGSTVSSCPVPFPETEPIGYGQLMAFDSETGQLIAGGAANPKVNNSYIIGFVDPKTCGWSPVAMFDLPDPVTDAGATAYCPNTHSLVFVGGDVQAGQLYVYTVDVRTGNVTHSGPINGTDGHDLQTMDYDPQSGKLVGIGLMPAQGQPHNALRTIASLDCTTMEYTVIGTVPQYQNQYGTVAALDVAGRGLYWIGQQSNATDYDPFYLIKNSIDNGSIMSVSDQRICQFQRAPLFMACPWSLQYLNA